MWKEYAIQLPNQPSRLLHAEDILGPNLGSLKRKTTRKRQQK